MAIDGAALEPMITFGTNPAQGMAVTAAVPEAASLPAADRAAYLRGLDYMDMPAPKAPAAKTNLFLESFWSSIRHNLIAMAA